MAIDLELAAARYVATSLVSVATLLPAANMNVAWQGPGLEHLAQGYMQRQKSYS